MKSRKTTQAKAAAHNDSPGLVLAAYYLTLLLFALGALFPEARLWGVSGLAYANLTFKALWFAVAAILPFVLLKLALDKQSHSEEDEIRTSAWTFLLASAGIAILAVVSFVVWKTQTHLLGDGSALISNLAKDSPVVKPREIGAELLVHMIKSAAGGSGPDVALRAYRIMSWGCGVVFLLLSTVFSYYRYRQTRERILVLLALLSGGYLLLYFGYVENYAPLSVAVAAFAMTGVLVAEGRLKRWLILIPLGLAVFFHIVGVILVPPAMYVLLRGSALDVRWQRLAASAKQAIWVTLAVGLIIGVAVWRQYDVFFRLALVPLVEDKFTSEHYTLFSFAHLADIANLIVMLFPGVLVAGAAFVKPGARYWMKDPGRRFLLLTAVCTVGATFLLDPKLGMARDWDLLSFPGIPLVLLATLALVGSTHSRTRSNFPLLLMVALGFLVLVPRVMIQSCSSDGATYAERCMLLDKTKNRTSFAVLADYYSDMADTTNFDRVQAFRKSTYHQDEMVSRARDLIRQRQFAEARSILSELERIDPTCSELWTGLSLYHLHTGQWDSVLATTKLADGLNPYSPTIIYYEGSALERLGRLQEAKTAFERSVALDSTAPNPLWHLARLYKSAGDLQNYSAYLARAASKPDAEIVLLKEASEQLIANRDLVTTSQLLLRILKQSNDSEYVRTFLSIHPELDAKTLSR